jgi:ribonuclease R
MTSPVSDAVRAIAAREGLSDAFPDDVLGEVEALRRAPGIDDPSLVDWTGLPFVTVDGPGTRDLDQALHLEPLAPPGRGTRLRYAIADAAHYVAPGTALFREALARGASFYLPGFSVPMLPRPLSEDLVSLGPHATRRALVFDVSLDEAGSVLGFELVPARIESRAKLTFAEVDELFAGGPSPLAREPFAASLGLLGRVGEQRAHHEDRKHMVRYRRVEASLGLDGSGALVTRRDERGPAELANEQLSILCNALGARLLAAGDAEHVQPIYRVHAPPEPERLASFERLVRGVARDRGLPDDPWLYRRAADLGLAGYLEALPTEGALGRLARALHRQAMVLNGRSLFSTSPSAHFGVGEAVYSRFTAPMRELVGIFCHKEARERAMPSRSRARADDEALRLQVIEAGNAAKDVQRRLDREVSRLVLDALFAPELALPPSSRPVRAGTVMGLSSSKIHVLLDASREAPELDVKIMLRDQGRALGGAWLDVEADGARLVVRERGDVVCRLGDEVRVRMHGPDGAALLV